MRSTSTFLCFGRIYHTYSEFRPISHRTKNISVHLKVEKVEDNNLWYRPATAAHARTETNSGRTCTYKKCLPRTRAGPGPKVNISGRVGPGWQTIEVYVTVYKLSVCTNIFVRPI